jgi:hypothetical protein
MTYNRLKTIFAWLAVLSIGLAGEAFAQPTMPSLVTQQTRLSTGGVSPTYVQLRAKPGVALSTDAYFWDQAPVPTVNVNYSMWLDANNNIVRSASFGPILGAPGTGAPGYLERVNATGTGLDWVLPTAIIGANNGLVLDLTSNPGIAIVQLGDSVTGVTGQGALSSNRFVHMAGKTLNFEGAGNFNVGDGIATQNITLDPTTAGILAFHHLNTTTLDTRLLVLGGGDSVMTRDLSSLVVADNGLTINAVGGYVELGSVATGGAPLLRNSFVTLSTHDMTFDGAGNFNVGDGTSNETIKLDPSATGAVQLKNIANFATPTATDRILMLDPTSPTGDKVWTRTLSSLVGANQGLVVDITTNPGTSVVQLGDTVDGGNPINVARFVTLTGATPSLSFDGTGALNLGTAGNLAVNIDTKASDMTIQSTNLDNATTNNFAWVDSNTHVVHRTTTSTMVRDNAAVDFIAIDHITGNIIKAISPTAGIYRGHVSWTNWQQTITLFPGQTILANASITATIENHATQGTVVIQVTNVTVGGATFDIETADSPTPGSFINYVVMNP